jgi:hypothetical protein
VSVALKQGAPELIEAPVRAPVDAAPAQAPEPATTGSATPAAETEVQS